MKKLTRFCDFWPYYLQEHARPGTRALHYVGTSIVVALIAIMPFAGRAWMAVALPVAGYGFAWAAHGLIERNRPATFRYPLWSLRADFLMWYRFLTGRIDHDLAQAGVRPDGTVDPARRIAA
ncbi:Mpo1-like protein [Sphingobium sp.]|uniref:Mpo1-like protein n=1 Tax=Sphingobium sp. TaxID=1912891 RepID=UPI003B3AA1E2